VAARHDAKATPPAVRFAVRATAPTS
jgi:hypothetical protein